MPWGFETVEVWFKIETVGVKISSFDVKDIIIESPTFAQAMSALFEAAFTFVSCGGVLS